MFSEVEMGYNRICGGRTTHRPSMTRHGPDWLKTLRDLIGMPMVESGSLDLTLRVN